MGGSPSREGSRDSFESLPIFKSKATIDDFIILKYIGKGRFGKVYQVRHKPSSKIFAMKSLKKSQIFKDNQIRNTKNERDILASTAHNFLVKLHYAFKSETKLHLVMDYVSGGELFTHLKCRGSLPETWVMFYGAEILCALNYLHGRGIAYRDLKPENVLVHHTGHIKLADFGLSKSNVEENKTDTICGTPAYLSPEMLKGDPYDFSVDIWALGILMYELASGTTPFYHKNRIAMSKRILNAETPYPPNFSVELKSLLDGLLKKDPKERFTVADVKNHAFFSQMNWQKLEEGLENPPFVPSIVGELDTTNFREMEFECSPQSPTLLRDDSIESESYSGFSFVDEKIEIN